MLDQYGTLYESSKGYIALEILKPVQLHNGRAPGNGVIAKGGKYILSLESRMSEKERYYSPYKGSLIQKVKVGKGGGLSRDAIRLNDDLIEKMIAQGIVKDLS